MYEYYIKAIISSYKETLKYSKLFFLLCIALHFGYLALLYIFALEEYSGDHMMSLKKLGYFIIFAYVSLFLMENIEYIEHYGLVYRK